MTLTAGPIQSKPKAKGAKLTMPLTATDSGVNRPFGPDSAQWCLFDVNVNIDGRQIFLSWDWTLDSGFSQPLLSLADWLVILVILI